MMILDLALLLMAILTQDLDLALSAIARQNNASAHGTRFPPAPWGPLTRYLWVRIRR